MADPIQQEVQRVPLLESDLPKLVFAFPLSAATTCTVRVDGPFGPKEAANLIRLLQAHVDVMKEPSDG